MKQNTKQAQHQQHTRKESRVKKIHRKTAAFFAAILTFALIISPLQPALAATNDAVFAANSLYALGLFNGADTNPDGSPIYELDRALTRQEAVTLLVRFTGGENDALSSARETPFTDLTEWAAPYIGYAFEAGLTDGVSETLFGSADPVTPAQYFTFILRALGYESGTDYAWSAPFDFAEKLGLPADEYRKADTFTRGDAVLVSFAALSAVMNTERTSLSEHLLLRGAVTEKALSSVGLLSDTSADALTPQELYRRCSPAVFSIETFDEDGETLSTGSGFFIDEYGTAVTSYHVLVFADSAIATETHTGDRYSISGVYRYSAEQDWAVIKVAGYGFEHLDVHTGALSAGENVCAIGAPLGLTGTISDGIISHPSRTVDFQTFIQTTAPISSGSSGGPLIDSRGRVIGIISASFISGQNLNLAVPMHLVDLSTSGKLASLASITPEPELKLTTHGGETEITEITLRPGETKKVDLTHNLPGVPVSLTAVSDLGAVVDVEFDDWTDKCTVPLKLIAGDSGTATVEVTLNSTVIPELVKLTLEVTVEAE